MTAKIFIFDIETAPIKGWTWSTYQTNVIRVIEDWYMLTWSGKWYGEKKIVVDSLPKYVKNYKKDPKDDKLLVQNLWEYLDKADIVVAHNGNRFDIKKVQARFIYHNMPPPSPFKTVDTLSVARAHAAFTSNRLDSLGQHLGLGQKVDTGGFDLWEDVMSGDMKAWAKMEKYNKQDVVLLEKVYEVLRPWTPRHPNVSVYSGSDERQCGHCGSTNLQSRGYYSTNSSHYRRWWCKDCHGWTRSRKLKDDGSTIVCDRK